MSKNKIACSNSDSILIAGKVNKVFFDKTGTLTKQGLDFISCRSVDSWDCGYWSSDPIALAMSSCHSLTKSAADDIIIGNPVDRAMFAASKAKLLDVDGVSAIVKDKRGKMLQVVRRFDFDHNTMTQSVIIRLPNGSLKAIVKGSGESISKRCLSDTMPASFDAKLDMEAKSGIYQIAIGWKELPKKTSVSRISRMDVENELAFIGVLNFSNQLREETPDVIRQLNEADVQPIMLTGE